MKTDNQSQQWLYARSGLAGIQNCTNFGRDNPSYWKEMLACSAHFSEWTGSGFEQPYFCNFPKERAKLHEGSAGRDCTVFQGNFLGDWELKMHNSHRELPVGCWVTGRQNCAIPKWNCQLATGVTSNRNYAIPGGNCQFAARGCWQGHMHWGLEVSLLIISMKFLCWADSWAIEGLFMNIVLFLRWTIGKLSWWWTGKIVKFSEGDRDRHLVFVWPLYAISFINWAGEVMASTQFLRGVSPRVTVGFDCPGGQWESWLN